jgi:hypothetical protein
MRITTTKLAPTGTAGEKVVARGDGRQITRALDYSSTDFHADVARELAGGPVKVVGTKRAGFIFESVEN